MARVLTHQAAHTYGVLDPLMIERRDTKFVPGSLADALNVIMLPQGGYRDRGGTTHIKLCRRVLEAEAVTAGLITAPNGGTIANAIDDDEATLFTTAAVNADPFVVMEVDFGSAKTIAAIDTHFKSAAARDDCVKWQYFDGAAWQDFAPAVDIRATGFRRRRFAREPEAAAITRQQWRLVITGGAGPGAIDVGEIAFWRESATLSLARARRYNYSVDRYYTLVITSGNIDIYRREAGVTSWLAACKIEAQSAMVPEVKHLPSDDTVLFFHQDMPPQFILRQGADDEWQWGRRSFEHIPLSDLGGVYTNGINEVQVVHLYGIGTGNQFDLQLEGETTTPITIDGTASNTATAIKNALEALPNVDAGLTVTDRSASEFEVEFSGDENAGRRWLEMTGRSITDLNGVVVVRTETRGKAPGEPIMSETAGWPAVGRFLQQRLILAGFRSRPKSWLMSTTGHPFNLDSERIGADAGRVFDLDDDDTNIIRDIHISSRIMFFLDGSVWSMPQDALSAENVPRLIKSDAPGIIREVRPISLDNAMFYVQRGGKALRGTVYSELEQNFIADNASVLSAFLMRAGPRDAALRRAVSGNDADLLLIPTNDGRLLTITMMRTQDVSGFAPHATEGEFHSVSVDAAEDVWFIAEREINADTRYALELMEADKLLDGAIEIVPGAPTSTLTGLDQFEGQTMHVIGDGDWLGSYEVTGGEIDLGTKQVEELARVGHWPVPTATDTPYYPQEEAGRPLSRKKRVFAADISLLDTTSLAIAANGGPAQNVPLLDADVSPMDTPLSELPFTGRRRVENLLGFTETAQLTLTQLFPGRLTVRSVTKEIAA